eukprot:scaffold168198_cov31-Tisochrysis_lutea.AAC.6
MDAHSTRMPSSRRRARALCALRRMPQDSIWCPFTFQGRRFLRVPIDEEADYKCLSHSATTSAYPSPFAQPHVLSTSPSSRSPLAQARPPSRLALLRKWSSPPFHYSPPFPPSLPPIDPLPSPHIEPVVILDPVVCLMPCKYK